MAITAELREGLCQKSASRQPVWNFVASVFIKTSKHQLRMALQRFDFNLRHRFSPIAFEPQAKGSDW
jgi:hypothetical protein